MPQDVAAINLRVAARFRDLFLSIGTTAGGMSQAETFRHLVVAAAERQLTREHPELRLCVECGEIVTPGPDGEPDWHTHRGRVIGAREEI